MTTQNTTQKAGGPMIIQKGKSSMPGYPITPDSQVTFAKGIPGFESVTSFCFRASDTVRPFMFMEALDREDVNFVIVDPYALCNDFHPRLPSEVVKRLELSNPEDVILLSIVTVGDSAEKTTANLLCPLVINSRKQCGEQVILEGSDYPLQYSLATAASHS